MSIVPDVNTWVNGYQAKADAVSFAVLSFLRTPEGGSFLKGF